MANKNIQLKNKTTNIYPLPHYPIGAVYMSYNSTTPALLFGGVWQQIKDVFLYANTSSSTTKQGEVNHKLTITEMPSHTHNFDYSNGGSSTSSNRVDCLQDSGSSSITLYTSSTGGNGSHNNMPPYLAVYMWRKVGNGTPPVNNVLDEAILDELILE